MGNKCCSKRQDQGVSIAGSGGYKKNDSGYPPSGSKQNGSLDSNRYTPDPNQKQLKPNKPGVDIIRPRTNPRKSIYWIFSRISWFNDGKLNKK